MAKAALQAGCGTLRDFRGTDTTGPAAIAGPTRTEEVTVMALTAKRTGNRILDLLPGDESSRLLSSSQAVSLPHGQEVYRQDGPMPHVYFPTTGVFGIVVLMQEGKLVEGATVGNEGVVGLPAFLGVDFHPFSLVCHVPVKAVQVSA